MASIFRQVILVGLLTTTGARAEGPGGWQNLDAVDAAAAAALGDGGKARPVDRRIKLAHCKEVLTVGAVVGGAVAVACESVGWRIRVPVVVAAAAVLGPMMMRKGDPVSVVTGSSGVSVSIMGIADGEGRLGDRMRVRTGPGASGFVVGKITDPGAVRIY